MNHSSIARKITATLFAAHSLGSAAFIVTATVNTIAGAQLSGNPAWAGVDSSGAGRMVDGWKARVGNGVISGRF